MLCLLVESLSGGELFDVATVVPFARNDKADCAVVMLVVAPAYEPEYPSAIGRDVYEPFEGGSDRRLT